MNTHQSYIADAISYQVAVVANAEKSTRNYALNRAAFILGTIPGTQLGAVVDALLPAACTNGYVAEDGKHKAVKVIECGFQNGQRKLGEAPRPNRKERRRIASES